MPFSNLNLGLVCSSVTITTQKANNILFNNSLRHLKRFYKQHNDLPKTFFQVSQRRMNLTSTYINFSLWSRIQTIRVEYIQGTFKKYHSRNIFKTYISEIHLKNTFSNISDRHIIGKY